MTGGTRHEWDSMAREVQAAIAKTRVDGGNYMACRCGSNKFVSFKSRLRCESCGELYQRENKGEQAMSGGMEEMAAALKKQVGGDHYRKLGDYQPWKVLKAWLTPEEFRGYMKGTAIVYLAREADKGGNEDIEKGCHTLQGYIESGMWG